MKFGCEFFIFPMNFPTRICIPSNEFSDRNHIVFRLEYDLSPMLLCTFSGRNFIVLLEYANFSF